MMQSHFIALTIPNRMKVTAMAIGKLPIQRKSNGSMTAKNQRVNLGIFMRMTSQKPGLSR